MALTQLRIAQIMLTLHTVDQYQLRQPEGGDATDTFINIELQIVIGEQTKLLQSSACTSNQKQLASHVQWSTTNKKSSDDHSSLPSPGSPLAC
jgi:hypothetical protein